MAELPRCRVEALLAKVLVEWSDLIGSDLRQLVRQFI
jgi:hypothetical protein